MGMGRCPVTAGRPLADVLIQANLKTTVNDSSSKQSGQPLTVAGESQACESQA